MDGAVGAGIAEHLGIPVIMHAVQIEVLTKDTKALQVCKRLPKGMRETYEVSLPCVVAVAEGLNQPRYVPLFGKYYRQGLTKSVEQMTVLELGITPEALSPKTTILEVGEMKPRIRIGTKVTGLSLEEKMRLLTGDTSKTGNKRELIVHEPQRAAQKILEKLSERLSEEKAS
jgi:electron transfer flavoprotein alpha/beta subunit